MPEDKKQRSGNAKQENLEQHRESDAIYKPLGLNRVASLTAAPDSLHFVNEAYRHCKAIASDELSLQFLKACAFANKIPGNLNDPPERMYGVFISNDTKTLTTNFIKAIVQHRFWERELPRKVPA